MRKIFVQGPKQQKIDENLQKVIRKMKMYGKSSIDQHEIIYEESQDNINNYSNNQCASLEGSRFKNGSKGVYGFKSKLPELILEDLDSSFCEKNKTSKCYRQVNIPLTTKQARQSCRSINTSEGDQKFFKKRIKTLNQSYTQDDQLQMKHFIPNKDVNDSSLNYGRSESFFLNQSMDSEYYGGKKVKFLKYKPKERKGHHAQDIFSLIKPKEQKQKQKADINKKANILQQKQKEKLKQKQKQQKIPDKSTKIIETFNKQPRKLTKAVSTLQRMNYQFIDNNKNQKNTEQKFLGQAHNSFIQIQNKKLTVTKTCKNCQKLKNTIRGFTFDIYGIMFQMKKQQKKIVEYVALQKKLLEKNIAQFTKQAEKINQMFINKIEGIKYQQKFGKRFDTEIIKYNPQTCTNVDVDTETGSIDEFMKNFNYDLQRLLNQQIGKIKYNKMKTCTSTPRRQQPQIETNLTSQRKIGRIKRKNNPYTHIQIQTPQQKIQNNFHNQSQQQQQNKLNSSVLSQKNLQYRQIQKQRDGKMNSSIENVQEDQNYAKLKSVKARVKQLFINYRDL